MASRQKPATHFDGLNMRAMILAAGRGERMRPLTDTLPKPLIPVGGKPLIVWHIENLARAGVKDIVINHAWLGKKIEDYLGNGSHWGLSIQYSPEASALETAGGIATAMPMLGNQPFIVVNGDVWCDWDFKQSFRIADQLSDTTQSFKPNRKLAWLLMIDNPEHHPNGDFVLQHDGLISDEGAKRLTFSGIGLYHPALFKDTIAGQPAKLAPLLRSAMKSGSVLGTKHTGRWVDVGTPERLASLNNEIQIRN